MTAYYNEHDPGAAAWLRELIAADLIAKGEVDERSIADVRPNDLRGFGQCHFFAGIGGWSLALRSAGVPDHFPIWTGSCPCQPFSAAGKRIGFDDPRHLWPYWRYLIAQCRPAICFGEQVAAASDWLRLVRSDLEALEYAVGAMPVEAASAGADHLRDRFWFVADDGCRRRAGSAERQVQQPRRAEAERAGERVVANANSKGQQRLAEHGEMAGQRGGIDVANDDDAGLQGRGLSAERTDKRPAGPDGMADADKRPSQRRRVTGKLSSPPGDAQGQEDQRQRLGNAPADRGEGVGNVEHAARIAQREPHDESNANAACGQTWAISGSAGSYEWVIGADGKARRVKSGVRLLVDGFPERMGLLRGFGNAIDPRPAAAFIKASIEALTMI